MLLFTYAARVASVEASLLFSNESLPLARTNKLVFCDRACASVFIFCRRGLDHKNNDIPMLLTSHQVAFVDTTHYLTVLRSIPLPVGPA